MKVVLKNAKFPGLSQAIKESTEFTAHLEFELMRNPVSKDWPFEKTVLVFESNGEGHFYVDGEKHDMEFLTQDGLQVAGPAQHPTIGSLFFMIRVKKGTNKMGVRCLHPSVGFPALLGNNAVYRAAINRYSNLEE